MNNTQLITTKLMSIDDYPNTEQQPVNYFSITKSVLRKKELKVNPIAVSNSDVNLRREEDLISKKASVEMKKASDV